MNFFDVIDEDKLLQQVTTRLKKALIAWLKGMAADETALMNQITSEFNLRYPKSCDIGKSSSVRISTEIYELHRKGINQIDQYGSDLAITVSVPGFTKTAFFQFKMAKNDKAQLEIKQLKDAKCNRCLLYTSPSPRD